MGASGRSFFNTCPGGSPGAYADSSTVALPGLPGCHGGAGRPLGPGLGRLFAYGSLFNVVVSLKGYIHIFLAPPVLFEK